MVYFIYDVFLGYILISYIQIQCVEQYYESEADYRINTRNDSKILQCTYKKIGRYPIQFKKNNNNNTIKQIPNL